MHNSIMRARIIIKSRDQIRSCGIHAFPIIAKGRGEHGGSDVDFNDLFGIDETRSVLVADFEDMSSDAMDEVWGWDVTRSEDELSDWLGRIMDAEPGLVGR